MDLERRKVRTINEFIMKVEALTHIRLENPNGVVGEDVRGSHYHGGRYRVKFKEHQPHPKNSDTYRYDGKKS